jgi:hypothetical protein
MADHGVTCSMSRSGNVWDNAAMESFFSSLKTERIARRIYRTRDEARAHVFDYIERFYNTKRRHSTIGYLSPMEFGRRPESLTKSHLNRQQLSCRKTCSDGCRPLGPQETTVVHRPVHPFRDDASSDQSMEG